MRPASTVPAGKDDEMTDRDATQPTEHEQRVSDEMTDRRDVPDSEATTGLPGAANRVAGDPGTPSYEAEVEAERRGITGEDVEEERAEDDRTPLDAAYKPKSG